MLNNIILQGRFCNNVELRYTNNNTPVCSFTLAVDRDYQSGGTEKQTDFIECVAWNKTAEFVGKHFLKGSMAIVAGRLQMRDWTDNQGNKRRNAEVIVSNIYFGEKKKDSYGYDEKPRYVEQPKFEDMSDDEETLPF